MITRRDFIKIVSAGAGVGITINWLPSFGLEKKETTQTWSQQPGQARWRIDGIEKVTGAKVFARDFSASDFKAWPQKSEKWVYAIRANRIDHVVTNYNLDELPSALKPCQILDFNGLIQKKINKTGPYMVSPLLTEIGKPADYYGQPVALLIFPDYVTYKNAVKILNQSQNLISYGESVSPLSRELSPKTHYVKSEKENFDFLSVPSDLYEQKKHEVAERIRNELSASENISVERSFFTQATDPYFMEPESGLAWLDQSNSELNLVLGTQSPKGDAEACASLFSESSIQVRHIKINACYLGGGFGGKSHSHFPMWLALAAGVSDGPVRWAYTRSEQFQCGLKRCETEISEQIVANKHGKILGIKSEFKMNAGGERNLTPFIAQFSSISSLNAYSIPLAISSATAFQTRGLIGGSQRGFGGPQAYLAIETLIDELSTKIKIDPFELRRRNLLKTKDKIITGAAITQNLMLETILFKLESHRLWKNRFRKQKKLKVLGYKYGVGFALANQAYGTNADGVFGAVKITEHGIEASTTYVEMGSGAATALGIAPAKYLGNNADRVHMGVINYFDRLNLTTETNKDGLQGNNFVYRAAGSSSACLAAHFQFHGIEQAAKVLFEASILPAAEKIWESKLKSSEVFWRNGNLVCKDFHPLSITALFDQIKVMNLPVASLVHASYCTQFVKADYLIKGEQLSLPLDYVALEYLNGEVQATPRKNLDQVDLNILKVGRSAYSPCGQLVESVIDRDGRVRVKKVVSCLVTGKLRSKEIVEGQSLGAICMAISNTLLEDCPNDDSGPGSGKWNLGNYEIMKFSERPQHEFISLEGDPSEDTSRGIGEAVFCPTVPALVNSIAMALDGYRFSKFPIKKTDIKARLE